MNQTSEHLIYKANINSLQVGNFLSRQEINKETLGPEQHFKSNDPNTHIKNIPFNSSTTDTLLKCTCSIIQERSYRGSAKIKITLTWNSNPTCRYTSKRNKITILKECLHSHVHCRINHSRQTMKTIYMFVNTLNELRKYGIYVQWNAIQTLKKK